MSDGEPLLSVSAELAVEDDREFLEWTAPELEARGLFVEVFEAPPLGSRVMAELRLARGTLKVEAVVERYSEAGEARGVLLRFPRLDSSSVQFVEAAAAPGVQIEASAPEAPMLPPEPTTTLHLAPELATEAGTAVGVAPQLATEAETTVRVPDEELLRATRLAESEDGEPEQ